MRIMAAVSLMFLASYTAAPAAPYTLLKTVSVPGNGSWDYLVVDEAARRLYVSHGTQVEVLDADSYEIKGTIPDTNGVHGIALAPDLGRGFTSNGRADNVTIFDLKTLKKLGDVKTGKNPDAIIYDAFTKQVIAFNGTGKSATVIDAKEGTVTGTVELQGRPEFAAVDGAGNVFVNLEDKSTLVKIDVKGLKVLEQWPLDPGETPASLAIDPKSKRLFAGCRNKMLVVVNAENGKVVGKAPIGQGADATMFDSGTGNIFTSCGDGTVTVVHADGDDKYSVVETIKTKARSKTLAVDLKTHRLFVPAADYKASDTGGKGRPAIVPNSFTIMVYGN